MQNVADTQLAGAAAKTTLVLNIVSAMALTMLRKAYIPPSSIIPYHPWGFNGAACQTLAYCLEQTRHTLHQHLLESSVV